jgi:hypothetical protein
VKRVEVEWVDSLGIGRWQPKQQTLEEFKPEALHHRSLGWVLRDDESGLAIAASVSDNWNDQVADTTYIPRQAVIKVTEI